MDTLEFIKGFRRLCYSHDCCVDCPCFKDNNENCNLLSVNLTDKEIIKYIEIVEEWTKKHPIEMDWLKVPRNTPVLVRDFIDDEWQEEHFCAYFPCSSEKCGQFMTFDTEEQYATDINYWRYCKLTPEVNSTPYLKEVK